MNKLCDIKQESFKFEHMRFECRSIKLSKKETETLKQAFWLNMINYLTLQKIAEIALTKPSILKRMNSDAMW
jgi:hypothetical protein